MSPETGYTINGACLRGLHPLILTCAKSVMIMNGGPLYNSDYTRYHLDDPRSIAALEWLASLREYRAPSDSWGQRDRRHDGWLSDSPAQLEKNTRLRVRCGSVAQICQRIIRDHHDHQHHVHFAKLKGTPMRP